MVNQKQVTKLYILIVFLCVLILALGGYIVYDKIQTNNNSTETTDVSNNTSNSNSSDTDTLVSKLDDTKDWVYDAEYTKNVIAESYSTHWNDTYYAKDIVIPYININSSYANNANNEIKEVFTFFFL